MSAKLIQDLHAGISRRDWSSVEAAANRLRDEVDKTVATLAGTGIGSLPNDYPLSKLAADLLSEAETREREARVKALGDAAEAIFVMGAWSPNYEKLTPNTFDEGTSAAYEVVRELHGQAESALQSEGR